MRSLPYYTLPAACVSTLLFIVSCAGLPPPAKFPDASTVPSPSRAEAMARNGDHTGAATLYEALAARAPATEQPNLQLLAAGEWLRANRGGDVTRLLAGISGALNAQQDTQRRVLDAEVSLASGQAQQAWQKITSVSDVNGNASATYLDARMRMALATSRPVDAVRAEVNAERLVSTNADRSEWRSRLLAQLRTARERGIKLEAAASQDVTIKGWLELGSMLASNRGASLGGGADAARWRVRYPNHPAAELLSEALPPPLSGGNINRIALLLPLTSSTEARTMRDGFQYALNQIPAGSRPELKVYDTSTTAVLEQLAAARAEGAAFIVGPLIKTDVATVAAAGAQSVPVLALNALALEDSGVSGLYQFALSPEDEARDTARQILATGLKRGTALAPASEWGNRVLTAFTQELRAGGGTLLAQASYDTSRNDYSEAIKSVLGTTESEVRLRRVQSVTGLKLEFEPRRHADIEFIYAAASTTTTARLLRPQLGYMYAGDIPVYMSSAAHTPESREANLDLNGVLFPEMPWRLPDASFDAARADAEQSGQANWRSAYFAFGYDALQLALGIAGAGRDVGKVRVAGLSGQLTIAANGRVHRELSWALVRDGVATLVDPPLATNN